MVDVDVDVSELSGCAQRKKPGLLGWTYSLSAKQHWYLQSKGRGQTSAQFKEYFQKKTLLRQVCKSLDCEQ